MIAALLFAAAGAFSRGDVLVSESATFGPCVNGKYSASVTLLDGRTVRQIAPEAANGAVWSEPRRSFFLSYGDGIKQLGSDGTLQTVTQPYERGFQNMAIAKDGTILVNGWRYFSNQFFAVMSPDGRFLTEYDTIGGLPLFDLAGDQCTVYRADVDWNGTPIRRDNVCGGMPMRDLVRAEPINGIRVLADDGVIVSTDSDLVRYDANGNEVARFPLRLVHGETAGPIAIDPDGASLRVGTVASGTVCGVAARVLHVRIDDGTLIDEPLLLDVNHGVKAMAIAGEWRAAAPTVRHLRPSLH